MTYTLIIILTVVIFLIAILLAVITIPSVFELFNYKFGSSEFYLFLVSNRLKFLPSFVVCIAVFTCLLTYLREKAKLHREKIEEQSKVFLQLAKDGLEGAYEMLKDQNNNRITWIRASRDILHALSLTKEIKTPQYIEAYRLFEENIRHKLYLALTVTDTKTGGRKALPPQFFYGVSDWQIEKTLDEVAKATSSKIVVGTVSIDHIRKEPNLKPLSEKSVVTIFDFLEYPANYDDPLKKVKVWGDDWEHSYGVSQGARRFVTHVTSYHAINGKLIPRNKGENS